jgi:hypothetical protein
MGKLLLCRVEDRLIAYSESSLLIPVFPTLLQERGFVADNHSK